MKHKNQSTGINIGGGDKAKQNNGKYLNWQANGGKHGEKILTGMPFILVDLNNQKSVAYCMRTTGVNLAHIPWSSSDKWGKCGKFWGKVSTKVFGEGGLWTRDGLTGEGFTKLKNYVCDKGVKATAAFIAAKTGGVAAVAVAAAVPLATKECEKL